MYTKFPTGTTVENDQLTLPSGVITVDTERKALRLHDGVTQGGFEMVGVRAWTPPFLGEVAVDEMISGDELSIMLGYNQGTSINSTEPWLHFIDPADGKNKYIAKKPYRYNVSKNALIANDLVAGTRTVSINNNTYSIRLMTGADVDPWTDIYDSGGEWNRLFYPIHISAPTGVNWASYTNADLVLGSWSLPGVNTLCKEASARPNHAAGTLARGSTGITAASAAHLDTNSSFGWRPVLELVI